VFHQLADLANKVDGAGGDDQAIVRGDGTRLGQGGGEVRRGVGRDVQGAGGGEEVFEAGGAGVVDGGEKDLVAAAIGVSTAGVEEGKENLGHLLEVLVAETAEEEGAGLGLGELGDGGPEGPGAGGVVGDVEEEIGAFREGEEFETAGPFGVANSCFNGGVGYFVTIFVTY